MAHFRVVVGLVVVLLAACASDDQTITATNANADRPSTTSTTVTSSTSDPPNATSPSTQPSEQSTTTIVVDPLSALPSEVLIVPGGLGMEAGTSGFLANIGGCVGMRSDLNLPGGIPIVFEAGDGPIDVEVKGTEIHVAGHVLKLGEPVWLGGGIVRNEGLTVSMSGTCAESPSVWFAHTFCGQTSYDEQTGLCLSSG